MEVERERFLSHLQPGERGSRTCYSSLGVETSISVIMKMFLSYIVNYWPHVTNRALEVGRDSAI